MQRIGVVLLNLLLLGEKLSDLEPTIRRIEERRGKDNEGDENKT